MPWAKLAGKLLQLVDPQKEVEQRVSLPNQTTTARQHTGQISGISALAQVRDWRVRLRT